MYLVFFWFFFVVLVKKVVLVMVEKCIGFKNFELLIMEEMINFFFEW